MTTFVALLRGVNLATTLKLLALAEKAR